MITLDEHLADPRIAEKIRKWYPKVVTLQDLGLSGTDDCDIPARLRKHPDVTGGVFVTINWTDFWSKMDGDRHLTIVCIDLRSDQTDCIADYLHLVLQSRELRRKTNRWGKLILVRGCASGKRTFEIRARKSDIPAGPFSC